MKKINKLPYIILLALTVLFAVSVFGFTGVKTANAEASPAYAFEIAKYDIVYDIGSDCAISVTEDLTISYKGFSSTGFIRDIPVNGGVQVRNINVKKLVNGNTESVWYDVYSEDSSFLSVDIGDSSNKYGKQESYRITYDYIITNSVTDKGTLPLNPVGHGWECAIYDISIKLIAPEGYIDATYFKGAKGDKTTYRDYDDSGKTADGRTVITASIEYLPAYHGATFDLNFEKGAIKHYVDLTPYLWALVGLAVLALIIILKMFVFNKNYLTPVVNYEAPNKMDPLIMGKLIDNKVNSEDVTSLIYYWASKGYIKINLDDKNDPTLIRIMQTLPESSPSYEKLMYGNLFGNGDMVKPSQLRNKFYKTVEKVTAIVNKQTKGLYDGKSMTVSILFAVIGGLLLGVVPALLALTRVSVKLLLFGPFVVLIPLLVVYAGAQTLMYYKLKLKKSTFIGFSALLVLVCAIIGIFYVLLVPGSIIGAGPKAVLYILSCCIILLSVLLINRTKGYTEKLNDIIGFKNFITLAEKDQLEMMLEEDPQFYYHILPYAQVLGVTDKWEEKFASLTVQPPQWLTGDVVTTYIEFRILNNIIRSSMGSISSGMVSRPSSSGANGGGRGGFGGGFSGGGFGGGGGRGR